MRWYMSDTWQQAPKALCWQTGQWWQGAGGASLLLWEESFEGPFGGQRLCLWLTMMSAGSRVASVPRAGCSLGWR